MKGSFQKKRYRVRSPRLAPGPSPALSVSAHERIDYWRKHYGERAQFIYFIEEDGPDAADIVKIGIAIDPAKRVAELQCGNARALRINIVLIGDAAVEGWLHSAWSDHRQQGEWFAPGSDILAWARDAEKRQYNAHRSGELDAHWTKRIMRPWVEEWRRQERRAAQEAA